MIRVLSTKLGTWFTILILAASAAAAERNYLAPVPSQPGALTRDAAAASKLGELRRAAVANGTVRVIVGLRVPFAAEGALSAREVATQQGDIAAAARTLRSKMMARPSFKPAQMRPFAAVPFVAMELTPDDLDHLSKLPDAISIEPDTLSDPMLAQSTPIVSAPSAWSAGYTGAGQVVAVLDTGIDKNHPFLAGKVVSEACFSGGGNPSMSFCPGGVTASTATGSGIPCPLAYDNAACQHGTHVGGIIAGTNGSFSGVAKGAKLIALQVFSNISGAVRSYTSDQILALERVYALRSTYRIAAVNMSLGGGSFTSYCDGTNSALKAAIDNLRATGIATVISSGNNAYTSSISAPACISSAVSVGATWDASLASNDYCSGSTTVDKVVCFSNSAPILKLLAPGALINSSVPGSGYLVEAGTSMAAPHVAGAWAVIKQKVPLASVTQVQNALVSSGKPITDYRNGIVKPRINVLAALNRFTTIRLSAASLGVNEGTASIVIPVTRSNTSTAVSVNYATGNGTAVAGSDYTARSGTLSFAVGVATQNISIPILNDALAEANETFSVRLSNPVGIYLTTPYAATITIADNDTAPSVRLSASAYSVAEGVANLVIPVTRSNTSKAAAVNYATANGTAIAGSDYTARSGTLNFPIGTATLNISVPITNDLLVEASETLKVTLSNPSGMSLAAPSSATVTIGDNDGSATVKLGAASYSVSEGTATLSIPVTRSNTAATATVNYATAGGTATSGVDFTARSGTLSFPAGTATANISIPIINDASPEANESFSVSLNSPVGMSLAAPSSASVTILDNDVTGLSNNVSVSALSGAAGSARYFQINVPSGMSNLSILSAGGSGDLDIYVRRGAVPTLATYECRSDNSGNDEGCSYTNPAAGTYYVMVYGYGAYTGAELSATYATVTPLANGATVLNLSGSAGSNRYFSIDVPAGMGNLTVTTTGGTGDLDLYMLAGGMPTAFYNQCVSDNAGNDESCIYSDPIANTYYIRLYGYSAYSGGSITVSYSSAAAAASAVSRQAVSTGNSSVVALRASGDTKPPP